MKFVTLAAAGFVAASLAIGCDQNSTTTTPATPSAGATNDKATDAAAQLKTSAAGAQDKVGGMMSDATTTASDAGNAMVAQAKKLYDDATTAVSGGKFDDAQKYVDQLKALRDKLPADWQVKVDQLAKMVTDGKAKMGNLPSMPSMPK